MSSDLDNMDESDGGGVGAKKGFLYQDYAAALYVTEMLLDKEILAVRCEVTDDIDIIRKDSIEYIQVKTTDSDKNWTLTEFTETSKQEKGKTKHVDSILHKSLACDNNHHYKAYFRILSPRNVQSSLSYLTIKREDRSQKSGREKLVKSISRKLNTFTSATNHGAEYWVDNAYWEVIDSQRQIELEAKQNIQDYMVGNGYSITTGRETERILDSILVTVTKRSAISRKIFTADAKTYYREDALDWIDTELIEIAKRQNVKIYTKKQCDTPLLKLIDLDGYYECDKKNGDGLKQGFLKKRYRYDHIAKTLKEWLPEILFSPEQLSELSGSTLNKFQRFIERVRGNQGELKEFIGRLLLHAQLRGEIKSEPITISIDSKYGFKRFDNAHIVRAQNEKDELWLGLSYMFRKSELNVGIENICTDIDMAIDCIDDNRGMILDQKDDRYLIKHDINEILQSKIAFDDISERFKFVVFLGYESDDYENNDYDILDDELIEDVEHKFKSFFTSMIQVNDYYDDINFHLYIYPLPCMTSLIDTFTKELNGGV